MDANHEQLRSPSYQLPVYDRAFLLRDELRPIRFALEFAKAELLLRDWGVRSTVVVFGSSRAPSPERLAELRAAATSPEDRVRVERAEREAHWYDTARDFARLVSCRGGALGGDGSPRDNVIATGGGPGIMEAANRGAADVGAPSIGFNIELPLEQQPNPYSTPALTFQFHYFAMRKMHLAMRARALAVFPGGFGTLDEMFELLTLQQTGKAPLMPILLFGAEYWREIVDFDALARHGMIDLADLDLFEYVNDPEQAWAALLRRGLAPHSSRPDERG